MRRPDIELYKSNIKECSCNVDTFCEEYGCRNIKELIDYIEFLEKSTIGERSRTINKQRGTNL